VGFSEAHRRLCCHNWGDRHGHEPRPPTGAGAATIKLASAPRYLLALQPRIHDDLVLPSVLAIARQRFPNVGPSRRRRSPLRPFAIARHCSANCRHSNGLFMSGTPFAPRHVRHRLKRYCLQMVPRPQAAPAAPESCPAASAPKRVPERSVPNWPLSARKAPAQRQTGARLMEGVVF
jgi:hypothetical protein